MWPQTKSFRDAIEHAELDGALLASLVHASPAVLYSCRVSADCGTIAVTPNVQRVLGYAPADFISDPSFWAVRIHPEDSVLVFEEMPRLFREGQQVIEYRFRCADGRYIWLRDHMRLESDEDGKAARILGCWIQITERLGATFIANIICESTKTTTATAGGFYAK
jgi:PAS domain S-box-containing protein